MSTYVRSFVCSCAVCEQACIKIPPGIASMECMQTGFCFERVGIDLAGPFPTSCNGFIFILVAIDYFSCWAEAFPLRVATAESVSRALVDGWVSRLGLHCVSIQIRDLNLRRSCFRLCVVTGRSLTTQLPTINSRP